LKTTLPNQQCSVKFGTSTDQSFPTEDVEVVSQHAKYEVLRFTVWVSLVPEDL